MAQKYILVGTQVLIKKIKKALGQFLCFKYYDLRYDFRIYICKWYITCPKTERYLLDYVITRNLSAALVMIRMAFKQRQRF